MRFRPGVQRDDPAGERAVLDVVEPGRPQQPGQRLRVREAADAGGQVRVRLAALQHLAEQRHDPVEPEPVERRERPGRLRDLEDRRRDRRATSTRRELREPALEVGDVADAEADGRRLERAVLEGQREHVALDPRRPRPTSAARARASAARSRARSPLPPTRTCARPRGRRCRSRRRARGRPAGRPPPPRSAASAGRARRSSRGSSRRRPARSGRTSTEPSFGRERAGRHGQSLAPPLDQRVLEPELVERPRRDEVDEVVDASRRRGRSPAPGRGSSPRPAGA